MDVPDLAGLKDLWRLTLGDPRVCVAVLDGPVDRAHPSLLGADLTEIGIESVAVAALDDGFARKHGTHVVSIVFGQTESSVPGVAPGCRGLLLTIFRDAGTGLALAASDQAHVARAIHLAIEAGAQIINLSGGQFSPEGAATPELAGAVAECVDRDVLIVAAAGNDGCDCLHVPGALPSVLAVGAMDDRGEPLSFSNWGEAYRTQGLLAPGEQILGAVPGGGTTRRTGTSFAAPLVSGVAALLLSLCRQRGEYPSPLAVRDALLQSATPGPDRAGPASRRWLAGRLNLSGAVEKITRGDFAMSAPIPQAVPAPDQQVGEAQTSPLCQSTSFSPAAVGASAPAMTEISLPTHNGVPQPATPSAEAADAIAASGCGCATCRGQSAAPAQLVFALGSLGYDFGGEARRDSFKQHMANLPHPSLENTPLGDDANPHDPTHLLDYLDQNPWDAASIVWTLNVESVPTYAIAPNGPFATHACERLRQYFREQLQGVERMSVAGVLAGLTQLSTGQTVPVIVPELRGMYNWKTASLVSATLGPAPAAGALAAEQQAYQQKARGLRNFLDRVYYELRNRGTASQERAVNFAATQTFELGNIYNSLGAPWELDHIEVERSPLCRKESDCWDVKLLFFNPETQVQSIRKVYRLTVDVSDVVPVTIGRLREWFVR
ncbi:MAG TPA: PatA/PatG family cyanobactin maturation protease [Isosphaeraceae bacterium]|nr:PatA/PatG family cyanobactin maturation protease [Isosphaeraceae bacterium]